VVESKKKNKKKKPEPFKRPPYPVEPNFVKVYINESFDNKLATNIFVQLADFINYTPLKFKKQSSEVKNEIGINFYPSDKYSIVELSTSEEKPTNVFLKKGLSENDFYFYMGYAFGLVPEIKRDDSKDKVYVHKNAISKSNYEKYYKKENYDSKIIANSSFEFYSSMFFSRNFKASKKGQLTYKFKGSLSKYYEKSVNHFKRFTHNDYKRLWSLYFNGKCENDCQNGGYHQTNCICICPIPFTGSKCETLRQNTERNCGKTQTLSAKPKIAKDRIQVDQFKCYYSIKAKKGKKVQFNILNLTSSIKNDCKLGFGLEVKYRKDKGASGLRLCGNYKNIFFPALTSEVILIFNNIGSNKLEFSYKEV
uniref:EGF-like domain-containing protein n=1 Tax=Strongyloides venezuelensis TaxID=75913 RepID=A0A0K0FWU4_STRVS